MPSYAELGAKLLTDAAAFFRTLGEQNAPIAEQMDQNAAVFEQMARLVVERPTEMIDGQSFAAQGAKLLDEAAAFFRNLAANNPPIAAQMEQNAKIFEQIAQILRSDPTGAVD